MGVDWRQAGTEGGQGPWEGQIGEILNASSLHFFTIVL